MDRESILISRARRDFAGLLRRLRHARGMDYLESTFEHERRQAIGAGLMLIGLGLLPAKHMDRLIQTRLGNPSPLQRVDCSWCHLAIRYQSCEKEYIGTISHGICPACAAKTEKVLA